MMPADCFPNIGYEEEIHCPAGLLFFVVQQNLRSSVNNTVVLGRIGWL